MRGNEMTDVMERGGGFMKSEGMLLNVVCLVMALGFLALAGLSYMSSGNFISTDNLFFSSVAGMMALLFLLVPVTSYISDRRAKKAPAGEAAAAAKGRPAALGTGRAASASALAAASARNPVRFTDTVDARGRPIPPDVARMVDVMKDT
jgi:Zn-dependent protease with chaperone function